MPGILGYKSTNSKNVIDSAIINKMAIPVTYSPKDRLKTVNHDSFSGGVVDYGEEFPVKSAIAQNSGVYLFIDGEVYPDSNEVPQSLRDSDAAIQRAEYCLYMYLQSGPAFVSKLNGSFAISIYDSRNHSLHLYTDRFLSRPIFYWQKDGDFAFASSVRSLLCSLDGVGLKYDPIAVSEFFAFEKVISDRTIFSDIKRLPPAGHSVFSSGKLVIDKYFKFDPSAKNEFSSWKEASLKLKDILKRAIDKRTADKCGVGILLSGGMDSRFILSLAPDSVKGVTLVNADMKNQERSLTLKVADTRGVPCIELPRTTDYPVLQAYASVDINEGILSSFLACRGVTFFDKIIDSGVHAVIAGLYFDQVLKGVYINDIDLSFLLRTKSLPEYIKNRTIGRILLESKLVRESGPMDLISLIMTDELRDAFGAAREQQIKRISQWFSAGGEVEDLADRFPYENILAVSDLAPTTRTNRTRLIDRSLIYDNELADFAISIPFKWKRGGRLIRYALHNVSGDLSKFKDPKTGLPGRFSSPTRWPFIKRFSEISREVLKRSSLTWKIRNFKNNRKKKSSVHPFNQGAYHDIDALLAFSPKYQELVQNSINSLPRELFDIDYIRTLLADDLSAGKPRLSKIFTPLVAFSLFDTKWGPNANRTIKNCYLD